MKKLVILFTILMMIIGCGRKHSKESSSFILSDSSDTEETEVVEDSVFCIAVGKQDTFWYAKDKNDSVYLWAIVKGEGVHMIRDINEK